jgi:hypothetical protein
MGLRSCIAGVAGVKPGGRRQGTPRGNALVLVLDFLKAMPLA